MPLQGDIDYFKNIGAEGMRHSLNKPWSDPHCGYYLMELGAVMGLLPGGGRLLDLGCGTGWTSYYFARSGYDVVGQDVAPEAVAQADRMARESGLGNLRFVLSDYESLGFREEFDCAVFFDSLHHSLDEVKAIQGAYDSLKPGGILVTSEPGIGHERRSRDVIKEFGVTERDMEPGRIIRAGKQAGFRSFSVHPHASYLYISLFRSRNSKSLDRLFRIPGMRTLAAIFSIAFYKRASGIVVLRK